MSKDIASLLLAHLRGEDTTLALCWQVIKKNGDVIFGTDHDLDVPIATGDLAGTYIAGANINGSDLVSSGDMSVDNTEIQGAFSDSIVLPDLTVEDVQGGLLNNAPVLMFFCNWQSPDDGQCYLRTGFLGELTYDSNNVYKTELRGLTQLLSQNIVQTYAVPCNVVRFGDARCTIDVDAISFIGTVFDVTNRKVFSISGFTGQPLHQFNTGVLVGLTGANTGLTRQIKEDSTGDTQGDITLFEAFPETVVDGDTFTTKPGCDRTDTMCKFYDNFVNYRGYGINIPGVDAIMKGPVGTNVPAVDASSGGGGFWAPAQPGV